MICLVFNWLFYDPSWMLQISEFVWSLRSLAWVVLNNFLLIDATDRSKISSDQKRLFFAVSLYPLLFFANTPFKLNNYTSFMCLKWTLTNFSIITLSSTTCIHCRSLPLSEIKVFQKTIEKNLEEKNRIKAK